MAISLRATFLAAAVLAGHAAGHDRPNIVLLVADDMDYEHFASGGRSLGQMPTLEALAQQGVTFTHGFVPMSRCRPTEAALLTGMWPHQNGVYFNVGADHIDPKTCLANLLKTSGYATVGEGKFWEFDARLMGFSNYTIRNYETFVRWDQLHLFEWLEKRDPEQPFFLWWAPELPHVPHDPPERLLARIPSAESIPIPAWFTGDTDKRAKFQEHERVFYAMESWFDEGLTELVAKLKAIGAYDDTLFVFLIDNGWANGCVSKGWAHDKGLRTPVVFSWKDHLKGGASFTDLVSPVDVYATLLDFAGLPLPEWNQGVSLRPRLEGREFVPREALYGALYPLKPTEVSADPARDAYGLWARTPRWKYILSLKDMSAKADAGSGAEEREDVKVTLAPDFVRRRGEEELYDLEQDPHETRNLAEFPEHAETKTLLKRQVLDWWWKTGGKDLQAPE